MCFQIPRSSWLFVVFVKSRAEFVRIQHVANVVMTHVLQTAYQQIFGCDQTVGHHFEGKFARVEVEEFLVHDFDFCLWWSEIEYVSGLFPYLTR